jgi:hypothetical protein
VEIETPEKIAALSVECGGEIVVGEGFPIQDNLFTAVHLGGTIDARALPARRTAAVVYAGGVLLVRADRALAASVTNGGNIRYWGRPAVNSTIEGWGSIENAG